MSRLEFEGERERGEIDARDGGRNAEEGMGGD